MDVILEHGGCEIHGIKLLTGLRTMTTVTRQDQVSEHPQEQTELCDVDFTGQNGGGHIPLKVSPTLGSLVQRVP